MPSRTFMQARAAWFKSESADAGGLKVPHEHMSVYGGPREISKCDQCTVMEWQTRITGQNQWKDHDCPCPAHYQQMKEQCANVLRPEWLHLRRNYNFALGHHPSLPGLKCLFVAGLPHLLVNHGPKVGLMLWRKRMSPYQTTFCGAGDIQKYNLRDFDFIIMTMSGNTPILPKKNCPPVFLYCHDHHPPAIQQRAQELFSTKPAAVLTPYPSIWRKHFSIPSETRVIFTPFLADPFWAHQSTEFRKRKYDVMLIGVGGAVYPERVAMAELLKRNSVPFRLKIWGAGAPKVGGSQIGADRYGSPPMLLWSRHLAQAKICVFGQDKYGYLVNKYSEIPSACSLMVAPNIPDCKSIGLIPGTHFVALRRPVQTSLIPQLTSLVRSFKKHSHIALAGLQWFRENSERWLYDHFWESIAATLEIAHA